MESNMANRISNLLTQKGMTQKELAQKSGITESAISHYIKGDRVPRGVNLVKIANALGTSTDFLLNLGDDDKGNDFGITNEQFNGFIMSVLDDIKEVVEQLKAGNAKEKLQKVAENLQQTLGG